MRWGIVALCVMAASCSATPPAPIAVRLGEDACAQCRMTIVSLTTTAQIIRPGDEPVMFDDVGCLREYLATHPLADGAVAFVADHRSGEWIDARRAVFTRSALPSPMGSGLLAHRDDASRDLDQAATRGEPVSVAYVLQAVRRGPQ